MKRTKPPRKWVIELVVTDIPTDDEEYKTSDELVEMLSRVDIEAGIEWYVKEVNEIPFP